MQLKNILDFVVASFRSRGILAARSLTTYFSPPLFIGDAMSTLSLSEIRKQAEAALIVYAERLIRARLSGSITITWNSIHDVEHCLGMLRDADHCCFELDDRPSFELAE